MSADVPSKLVLLVDDDESLLDLMAHVVKKEGMRVERAVDGQEALRKIAALNPDLIVLDFMIPVVSGYDIVRQLQDSGKADIPIVIVTARQLDAAGIAAIRQEPNVKEFLSKPIHTAELAMVMHRILGTTSPTGRRA